MHFDRTNTYNLEGAFHGMRNPMNSWKRSDSYFGIVDIYDSDVLTDVCDTWLEYKGYSLEDYDKLDEYIQWLNKNGILSSNDNYDGLYNVAFLGPNDMELAQKLILAGAEHAKFTRQIFVSVDITAPLYWWKEFDTYKVGTVANSTSTMHKLSAQPITMNMFEFDNLDVVVDTYTSPHGGESVRIFSDYAEDIVDIPHTKPVICRYGTNPTRYSTLIQRRHLYTICAKSNHSLLLYYPHPNFTIGYP